MAPAYTRRLGRVTVTAANQFYPLYTAVAGTTIVRDLVVVNFNPGVNANVQVAVQSVTRDLFRPLYWRPALPPGSVHEDLRQELVIGETLVAAGDMGNLYVWATGYVFA